MPGVILEMGRDNPCIKGDVITQAKSVRDMVGVGQYLRLGRVAFTPLPLLLQVSVEGIGILHALDVTPGARVTIPVPGATDIIASFYHSYLVIRLQHPLQGVHARKSSADDDGIQEIVRFCHIGSLVQ